MDMVPSAVIIPFYFFALQEPVLQDKDVEKLAEYSGDVLKALNVLDKVCYLIVSCC